MELLKKIKIEYSIMAPSVRSYSSSGNIKGILDGLEKALFHDDDEDIEIIGYYLRLFDDWYSLNINAIRNNEFVYNKEEHERNQKKLSELRQQFDKEEPKAKDSKIKKGNRLRTAFDEYVLLKTIGEGGNGIVYEAETSEKEHVAIKVVNYNGLSRDKKKRFRNEMSFCLQENNKNIIQILDYGVDSRSHYSFYVMPLYHETLRSRIKKGITPHDAVQIFDSLLNGLAFAHSKNVFHRDIKPENILFAENSNECVICDFGIAHFPSEEMLTTVETKASDRLANFQYAAPEQRIRGGDVDGRADVFAAGLILNEMLTGQLIGGSSYTEIKEVYPEYGFLDAIVEKLFKQNPEDRLFPVNKIQLELQARQERTVLENKNKELSDLLKLREDTKEEYQEYEVPKILDARIDNNELVLVMDKTIPVEWFDFLKTGGYAHSFIPGYGPQNFNLKRDKKEISVAIGGISEQSTIKTIITYFREWLPQVTSKYNSHNKHIFEQQKREKIEAVKREIAQNERNQELSDFVKSII